MSTSSTDHSGLRQDEGLHPLLRGAAQIYSLPPNFLTSSFHRASSSFRPVSVCPFCDAAGLPALSLSCAKNCEVGVCLICCHDGGVHLVFFAAGKVPWYGRLSKIRLVIKGFMSHLSLFPWLGEGHYEDKQLDVRCLS